MGEDQAGEDQLAIRDLAKGTRDHEAHFKRMQRVDPILLLLIIRRKGSHVRETIGAEHCIQPYRALFRG